MANGDKGLLDGMAVWQRFIALVGIPGVIALYLVYVLVGDVRADIHNVGSELREHKIDTAGALEAMKVNLWVICRELAKSDSARAECKR